MRDDEWTDEGVAPPRSTVASGKYAIVTIGILAVTLASAAIWYQYNLQHRPLEYWGTSTASRVLSAPKVEALLLAAEPHEVQTAADDDTMAETLTVDDRTWHVVARREISKARGFSHVRRSLMMGGSYDWNAPPPAEPIEWRYALVFRGEEPQIDEAIVLLTADAGLLADGSAASREKTSRTANVQPVAEALLSFLTEQFPEPPAPEESSAEDQTPPAEPASE